MQNFIKISAMLIVMTILAACGGGGSSSGGSSGGGNGGSGGGGGSSTNLTVSSTSVTFEGRQFQAVPASQDITVTTTGSDVAQLVAGFATGVTPPDWLSVDLAGTVTSSTLTLGIITTDTTFGELMVPLRVVSANAAGDTLDTVDINITFDLEEGKLLIVDRNEITVSATPGSKPITEMVTLSSSGLKAGETISWQRTNAGVVGEERVTLNMEMGTLAPGETQDLEVTIASQGSGVDSTTFIPLDFTVEDDAKGASVTIRASSIDGLFSDPSDVNFLFDTGDVDPATFSVVLKTARFGDATTATWQAEATESWVSLVEMGASGLDITVDPSTLSEGRHEATITVTHDISAQVLEIPVVVIISGPALKVSQRGVALSDLSSLTHVITVTDTDGTAVAWTASTAESWLDVTASGDAGDPLTLTADTAGLATESLVVADVIVSSPDLDNDVTMKVGLWVGGTLEDRVSFNIDPNAMGLASDAQSIIADPVRPFVYVKVERPDAVRQTDLSTYNVFSGEQVGEKMLVDIDPNGDIMVSDDGAYLFISGNNRTGNDERTVAKIDLTDMTSNTLNLQPSFTFSNVVFARVKTQAVLISSRGIVMDVETESIVSDLARDNGTAAVSVSKDGSVECQGFDGGIGGEFDCVSLTGSGIVGEPIFAEAIGDANIMAGSFRLGVVYGISNNGENLILRDNPDFGGELRSVDLSDQTDNFLFNVEFNDLAIDSQDNIIVGTFDDSHLKVNVYDSGGTLIATDDFSTTDERGFADQIVLSGDESRVIQLNDNEMFIMPMPE